jgi:hypothetical protein
MVRTLIVSWLLVLQPLRGWTDDHSKAIEFFERKIRPVLVEHCYGCHSDKAGTTGKLRGGFKLDSKATLRKGGDSGPAVVPGKPEAGLLLASLKYDGDLQMPPRGKLPAAVIADFEQWIRDGAVDPRESPSSAKTGIDLEKSRQFWSFQVPRKSDHPQASIDHFIRARWAEKGLAPNPMADRRTLIRRVTFDLTGLPPTPEDVEAFLRDDSPDAWPKLVDRLLASPRYGERWGRYWLDVARYAEDQAHTFAVTPKKNAYLYRDWVIEAFNADMPYDQFVKLQIAGDLIADPGQDKFRQLAGLGFMGLGAEYYKNTAREQAIAEELDDRVDTLTRGFLGLTVACARCHDHKFDPIPTRDYYSLAGIYNGTSFTSATLSSDAEVQKYNAAQDKVKAAEARVNGYLAGFGQAAVREAVKGTAKYMIAARSLQGTKAKSDEVAKREGLKAYFLDRWVKYLDPKNAAKAPPAFKDWLALKPQAAAGDVEAVAAAIQARLVALELPAPATAAKARNGDKKDIDPLAKAMFLDNNSPFAIAAAEVESQFLPADAKPKLDELRAEAKTCSAASPPPPLTCHVVSGNGQEMKVYIRGNPATKGEPAPKGFLQVLPSPRPADGKEFTRLDLAQAIASPKNPLTARVIVNRVWAWHWGRGLVNTPSNFGELGERPTHPELLDHLASGFMSHGWSLKWLHRQILNSQVYQLASHTDSESQKADPGNADLWRGRRHRLDIEAWRDSLLFVSGQLDEKRGGPTFSLKDASARRRTVYAKVSRHELDSLLRLFDFPDANVTADKRSVTTVPQQQLFAMNSEFMVNQAIALAARLDRLATTDIGRVQAAYRLAYNREPDERERDLALRFLERPAQPDDKLTRLQQYAQAILASNEFLYVD